MGQRLAEREVQPLGTRAVHRPDADVTGGKRGLQGKRRGVEPAVKTALATGQLGRINEICPKEAFVSSTGQIRIVCGADIDSLGQTAGKGGNAGQSPVIQKCTGKGVRPFSAGFGKVPDVIDR